MILYDKAQLVPLDWVPDNGRLCAVRMHGSKWHTKNSCVKHILFVISACAPTNRSAHTKKDEFYIELLTFARRDKGSDNVVTADDFNMQDRKLSTPGLVWVAAAPCLPSVRMTEIAISKFVQKITYFCIAWIFGTMLVTQAWHPNSIDSRSQIVHIAVSYRWRDSLPRNVDSSGPHMQNWIIR